MKWRDAISDPPTEPGFYFVFHPRYGECFYGWNQGWGWDDERNIAKPIRWLDEPDWAEATK